MTITYEYMYEDVLNTCVNKIHWLFSVLHKLPSIHLLLQTLFLDQVQNVFCLRNYVTKAVLFRKNNTLKMLKSVNNKNNTQHAPDYFVVLQIQTSGIYTCSIDSRIMQHSYYADPLFKKKVLNKQCYNLRLPFAALNDRQSMRK